MNLPAADVFRLKPFLRKSGCRVTILGKARGAFLFHRTRKRKAFFLGFLLAASILYLLSSFIWNIQVTGNRLNSTQAVLEVLEREGIRHGQPKGKISCQKAADLLREEFENVVWVSARIQGTRLVLEIKENTESFAEEKKGEIRPSDLRATKEGTVVRIVTRSGVPKVKVGDPCEKGTVLISGQIPITDDSGEVVRTEEVPADGDVYLSSVYYYQNRIPRRYERRIYEEKEKDQYFPSAVSMEVDAGRAVSNAGNIRSDHQEPYPAPDRKFYPSGYCGQDRDASLPDGRGGAYRCGTERKPRQKNWKTIWRI